MFGIPLGMVVETAVAILLATTIGYCVVLNQRLKRLHADRDALRRMIADLVQATGLANASIQELKAAAVETDAVLNGRLKEAETLGIELANHINVGQQVADRLGKVTLSVRQALPAIEDDRLVAEPGRMQSALAQLATRTRMRSDAA